MLHATSFRIPKELLPKSWYCEPKKFKFSFNPSNMIQHNLGPLTFAQFFKHDVSM